ncbi:DEAD/DEAH box helicase [Paenibacillus xylaniclasticus]|uniref:DEAD/DEAH box helicase n=1 Tax=Paenibacillus xylaniclasticus TaxID=588083 RepID=UPI000FD6E425|nr:MULTISPECIES: DEAD/DEAH box helicase [Paenibacillus]GFN32565.1 hypothetical protein PCURB6_28250 [Paenibacillus curdlanolyticus]
MKLRDYQEECLREIKRMKECQKSLVVCATGGGKTVIFSKLAAETKGRVLIAVPSTELREQAEEKLQMIDSELDIGSVQGKIDNIDAKIVVATRQSLTHPKSDRLKRMLKHGDFEYLIVDEAHQAPKQIDKILKNINKNIKTIGFTATPYTRECIAVFGQPVFRRSIVDMIESEYLVEPYAILVQSKTNISHVKTTNGDFSQGELEEAVNNAERNQLIIESYKKFAQERTLTLVFAAGCDHGKELLKEFIAEGIAAEYVDGNTSKEERKTIIHRFKSKKTKVLINVMALTTGFDVPETDTIVICRPTKSRILYEQIIGRGLRLAENKKDCLIIDIQDITKKHDLMSISDLFETKMKSGETYRQAKKRNEDEKKAEKIRRKQLEQKRLEEEIRKKQEMELVAQRIKLFNKDMKSRVEEANLDWFRVNNLTYALSMGSNAHYVIENKDNTFVMYYVLTDKENRSVQEKHSLDSMKDMIAYVEKFASRNTYTIRNSEWKLQRATEAQRKFVPHAKTKWEVHKIFAANTINSTLNKYHKDKIKNDANETT